MKLILHSLSHSTLPGLCSGPVSIPGTSCRVIHSLIPPGFFAHSYFTICKFQLSSIYTCRSLRQLRIKGTSFWLETYRLLRRFYHVSLNTVTCNLYRATPEMAEIFDFFAISRMLEKQWQPPQADCLFFGTCNLVPYTLYLS
jgi:hypothetical protein